MKFDGSHLWLTNFGDDKLYKKTFVAGGAAGATANYSYAGKTNPTGLYLERHDDRALLQRRRGLLPRRHLGARDDHRDAVDEGHAHPRRRGRHDDRRRPVRDERGRRLRCGAGHVWKFQLAEEITTTS
jgi:hypothetical protein